MSVDDTRGDTGLAGEPVAVVGMSCRLPGADGPGAFWQLLLDGRSTVTDVPPGRPGTAQGPGGFLEHIDRFDPAFFGISPREASSMDPQQRLMLELSWEALEDAGIVPGRLRGTDTGVFVGAISGDYAVLTDRAGTGALTSHTMSGLSRGVIANRISYVLGSRGPSLVVDTAQSSSLVAVHLACESLRRGESETALAGGVHLNLLAEGAAGAAAFGALSPGGRCRTFDARADGYVRGEGGAVIVLKPLARAQADGDRVLCVFRGSATGNGGAADGLSVPSADAQAEVLTRAYRRAGVRAGVPQYVELHGTGTRRGDPVEAAALGAVLGSAPGRPAPLRVGSVKTNVGHLEGAAGVVGLLKTVLSIVHRRLPASLNFETPHPGIPLEELNLRVQDVPGPWPREDRPLVAGVSSFGMGGTNAHVVLEQPPPADVPDTADARHAPMPWTVSARSAAALRDQARELAALARTVADTDRDRDGLGAALATTRSHFEHRAVVLGRDRAELLDGLGALTEGNARANVVQGTVRARSQVAFVFPGQGSQWTGMARELLAASPVFRDRLHACADALAPYTGWSAVDVLSAPEAAPGRARDDVVQPVLFAVMVALAELWRSYGVRPAAVVGHSQGEVAAAYIAGALSLDDAARIVALRSSMVASLAGDSGGMASLALPAGEVETLLRVRGVDGRLAVAALNGPRSTVVTGAGEALDELVAHCAAGGVRARRIPVAYASHSPGVEPLRDRLVHALDGITPRRAGIAFYSTVTGGLLDTLELDAGYWYRNLREPVRFDPAVRALAAAGHGTFVESSPHPVLTLAMRETLDDLGTDAVVTGSLRRDEGGWRRFLTSVATVHVNGTDVAWPASAADVPRALRGVLPTYPFQRQSYWLEPAATAASSRKLSRRLSRGLGQDETGHPLLGAAVTVPDADRWVLTGRISPTGLRRLAGHTLTGQSALPGSVFVELALRAGAEAGCRGIDRLTLASPLPLPDHGAVHVRVAVGPADHAGRRPVVVDARPEDGGPSAWVRHADGELAPGSEAPGREGPRPPWPPRDAEPVAVDVLYKQLAEAGYEHGPASRGMRACWRRGDEVFAEIRLPDALHAEAAAYGLHPALLDSALHTLAVHGLLGADAGGRLASPSSWSDVTLRATGATALRVHTTVRDAHTASLTVTDPTGAAVAVIGSVTLRPADTVPASARPRPPEDRDGSTPVFAPPGLPAALPPASLPPADSAPAWPERLRSVSRADGLRLLTDMIRAETAVVLGYSGPAAIDERQSFKSLGLDSPLAVELRDRLNAVTGLRLPTTLLFDRPDPAAVAGLLHAELRPERTGTAATAVDAVERIRTTVLETPPDEETRARLIELLQDFVLDLYPHEDDLKTG
ncbi:acyltransferase domain-containing protein [Streptomyces sp. NPDC052496]|uniref:type I polyketide synthase n=1 Tax=Streptomyces sp. NPDC052496 TaxID=3154951 RepID=UPI00343773CF